MRFSAILLLILCCAWRPLMAQPQVLQYTLSEDSLARYAMLEITVDLQATFVNPYDPAQVRLQGIFYNPVGDSLVMPGFLMQPFHLPAPDQLVPDGPPVWRVRFSPDMPGTWQFRARLRDTTGMV
ncbi:MAG TPA: DUF5060 domain-containing protein, partial [Bacteroidales bacterium]|nr:DUF5060 domain-containing protein [Bacteroidales bacterium]